MTTTKRLNIPAHEWEQVRKQVMPHASTDSLRPWLECVELAVIDGVRRWQATDSFTCAQLWGGTTKAADTSVLLPRSLFRPARPTPTRVQVQVNRSWVRAVSDEWDRHDDTVEGTYPDLADLIDRGIGSAEEVRFTDVPKKGQGDLDILPIVIDDRGVYARNGNGRYSQIGTARFVPWSIWLGLNCRLLRRCVKTVPNHRAYVSGPTKPVMFVDVEEPVTVLQMPMRGGAHEWLGDDWREDAA